MSTWEGVRASFLNPAAWAALAAPVAPVALLASLSVWLVPSSVVLSDGALTVVAPPAWFGFTLLALFALAVAALIFGAIAASAAMISDLAGTPRSVGAAWSRVARRLPGHLMIAALLGVIVVVVLTLAFVCAVFVGTWLGVVVILVAMFVAAPLATAPAMLISADGEAVDAVRDAAFVTRKRSVYLARFRIFAALAVGVAVPALVVWLTQALDGSVLIVLVRDVLRLLALLVGALIAVAGPTAIALESRAPWRADQRAASNSRARVTAVALGLAALLIPPAATAGVSLLNPGNVARVTTMDAGRHWEDLEIVPLGDGVLVLSRIGDAGAIVTACVGESCLPYDTWGAGAQDVVALPDGSVLLARLVPQSGDISNRYTSLQLQVTRIEPPDTPVVSGDERRDAYFPQDFTSTTVVLIEDAVPDELAGSKSLWLDTAVAISLGADGEPVVALMTGGNTGDGLLRVFRCAALDCSDSRQVGTVELAWSYPFANGKWAILDVAGLSDGVVGVGVVQMHERDTPLRYVAVREGSDPVVQVLDDSPRSYETWDDNAGVRVAVNGDGTMTLAYRPHGSADAGIITCGDSECSTWVTESMLPSGAEPFYPSPTLAIDDTGRPMYLQRTEAGSVLLVSCTDVACTETVTTLVASPEYPDGPIGLTLTTDGRPLVIGAAPVLDPYDRRLISERSVIVECLDPRCGLP